MKKLILFESILILFFVLAWNISKANNSDNGFTVIGETTIIFPSSKNICDSRKDFIYLKCIDQKSKLNHSYIFCENSKYGKVLFSPNRGDFGRVYEMTSENDYLINFSDKNFGEEFELVLDKYTLSLSMHDKPLGRFYKSDCHQIEKQIP